MLAKLNTATSLGVDPIGITVEVDVTSRGMPRFEIVGLPNKAVEESKYRVRTALLNSGIEFPTNRKVTVNLAPADLPKEGSFCDLPIAVGVMCCTHGFKPPNKTLFFGEVSFDGSVRHTKGAFLLALYAKSNDFKDVFVPRDCLEEAASVGGLRVFPVDNLKEILSHLQDEIAIPPSLIDMVSLDKECESFDNDMSEVLGQEKAKRSLEIAAAGGHSIFMLGPPGTGKTLLSKAFSSILPPLSREEALDVTRVYSSVGGIPPKGSLITKRPFRSPHHTTSYSGMIGGGSVPKPGEISLAHRGVLFLDEFPEFSRRVLEALRQPMEEGEVVVSRSTGSFTFPSRFILIASSNPCPCGFHGYYNDKCVCTPKQIRSYRKKISGPILDRIDLFVDVPGVSADKLSGGFREMGREVGEGSGTDAVPKAEFSLEIRRRVVAARQIQLKRFESEGIFANSEMVNNHVGKYCPLSERVGFLLKKAVSKYDLSARSYFKLIKVARTIADLVGSTDIEEIHVAEALQYKSPRL